MPTVPINEEVLDEYRNLIDQCYASCVATSESFEVLGQICCLATTIDDFELPRQIYKFAHSSWFVASLMQVVNEGCAAHYFEQKQISEFDKQFSEFAFDLVAWKLGCVGPVTYNGSTRSSLFHSVVLLNSYATKCYATTKSIVRKFDAVTQLISEIVGACRSSQTTVAALIAYMQVMKNSSQQWQIQLELIDRLSKLLSLESENRSKNVKTACIAVELYLLLQFNLSNNEKHMDIRLAVLDLESITNVQVQKEKVTEVKDKCEKFKQAVKARTEECKENARDNFKPLLAMS